MNSRCSFFRILPVFLLALMMSVKAIGHGNCRFTFSTAAVVASGHTEHPLFDITKPETMHTIGTALRYELVTLGKNPSSENIDALHAQLPQIIAWVKKAPERIDAEELVPHEGYTYFERYHRDRAALRAKIFPELIRELEEAYASKYMTYRHYVGLQYQLALLASPTDRGAFTSIDLMVRSQSDYGSAGLRYFNSILIATFDNDPSHLDFILSLDNFNWTAVKTTFSPDLKVNRHPLDHYIHDTIAHDRPISQTLFHLTPYERQQLLVLRDTYINQIRPNLPESKKPFGDAIMAHLTHGETVFPSGMPAMSGLLELSFFASMGNNDPFLLAASRISELRGEYPNYREELKGDDVVVERELNSMALFLKQKFTNHMEFGQEPVKFLPINRAR